MDGPPEDPVVPAPIEPERPRGFLWPVYLVFRPQQFFRLFVTEAAPALTVLTTWLYGIASVMDRIEQRLLLNPDRPLAMVAESWGGYWGISIALGVLSAALIYTIGGWWYRLRLRWSGATNPDPSLSRRVYIFSAQVHVVPLLLYTVWETFAYETPVSAVAGDDVGGIAVIVALFWSIYVSYRGVRTVFEVRKWRARVWFLILPLFVFAAVFAGFFIAAFLKPSLFEPAPEVGRTLRIEREAFTLEYPGNWSVNEADEDYHPDRDFSIEPSLADAMIRFWFYDEPMDSRECVDQTRDRLAEAYKLGPMRETDRWSNYRGAGYEGDATIENKPFALILFCRTHQTPPFEILQIVEKSALERTRPGFDMIRDSLKVQSSD